MPSPPRIPYRLAAGARRVVALGAIGTLAALLVGCGDDGGSADGGEGDYVDAIAAQIEAESETESGLPVSEDEARCLATGFVDALGVDGLVDLGLDVEAIEAGEELDESQLSEDEARTVTDAMFECVDFTALFVESMAGSDVSEESAECLAEGLEGSDAFRDMIVAGMLGGDAGSFEQQDPETQAAFTEIVTECLSGEELLNLGS